MNLKQFNSSAYSSAPHFLLVGNPVDHSLSPLMHNTAAKHHALPHRYYAVHLESGDLSSFASYLNNEQLKGVNVTIPYKQALLSYVDQLEESCNQIGAINTIGKKGHQLIGHNTDAYGFCKPLESFMRQIEGGRAVIFGTGGAARAVVFGLTKLGVEETLLVSRSPKSNKPENWPGNVSIISYDSWPSFAEETTLFVNATPLGMEPDVEKSPVKDEEIHLLQDSICYDIVYKPLETTFLKRAARVKAQTISGLDMLIYQGSRSFELWTGKTFPIDLIRTTLKKHL